MGTNKNKKMKLIVCLTAIISLSQGCDPSSDEKVACRRECYTEYIECRNEKTFSILQCREDRGDCNRMMCSCFETYIETKDIRHPQRSCPPPSGSMCTFRNQHLTTEPHMFRHSEWRCYYECRRSTKK